MQFHLQFRIHPGLVFSPSSPSYSHTHQNYGLKLRGSGSSFDPNSRNDGTYQLELKIRKLNPSSSSTATASPSSNTSLLLPSPENWKKVVRSHVSCSSINFARPISQVLEGQTRVGGNEEAIMEQLRQLLSQIETNKMAEITKTDAEPFRFVEVKKRRVTMSDLNAEQTDIEVRFLNPASLAAAAFSSTPPTPASSSSSSSPSSPTVYRFRSICFEGPESVLRRPGIAQLFTHILQRGAAASASSSSSAPALSSSSLTLVAGYPEFLLQLLSLSDSELRDSSSSSSLAASSVSAAAAAAVATNSKRVELKKWNAVTLWSWDIEVDNVRTKQTHRGGQRGRLSNCSNRMCHFSHESSLFLCALSRQCAICRNLIMVRVAADPPTPLSLCSGPFCPSDRHLLVVLPFSSILFLPLCFVGAVHRVSGESRRSTELNWT